MHIVSCLKSMFKSWISVAVEGGLLFNWIVQFMEVFLYEGHINFRDGAEEMDKELWRLSLTEKGSVNWKSSTWKRGGWKGCHLEEDRVLFQLVVEDSTCSNGLKLQVGRYQWDIREKLTIGTVLWWNQLPWDVVGDV